MVECDIESMDGFSISIVPHPTGSPSLWWECLYNAPSQWLLISSLEIVYTAPSHWIPISMFPIFILPPPTFPVSILPIPTGSPSLCWNVSVLHHPTESPSPCSLSLYCPIPLVTPSLCWNFSVLHHPFLLNPHLHVHCVYSAQSH